MNKNQNGLHQRHHSGHALDGEIEKVKNSIVSLQRDRDSLMAQAAPNRNLITSIDRRISQETTLLEQLETKKKNGLSRHMRHEQAKADTLTRKAEQNLKKELKKDVVVPKINFGSTLKLNH